jgi:hypothetical protein
MCIQRHRGALSGPQSPRMVNGRLPSMGSETPTWVATLGPVGSSGLTPIDSAIESKTVEMPIIQIFGKFDAHSH